MSLKPWVVLYQSPIDNRWRQWGRFWFKRNADSEALLASEWDSVDFRVIHRSALKGYLG